MKRGNHKSSQDNPNIFKKLIVKDVELVFQLPISINSLLDIPHACIAPYGAISQQTVDEETHGIQKHRASHDQSFQFSSKNSVNDRVHRKYLLELIYGDALRRIAHYINSLHMRYKNTPILIGKYDFIKAYKRLTMWGQSSVASASIIQDISFISLCLILRGTPCPLIWCPIAEIITDFSNTILFCSNWNVETTHNPHSKNIPEPKNLPDNIPFQPADPADVLVNPIINRKSGGYIEDIIPVVPHIGDREKQASNAVPIIMHILGRPISQDDPITREDLLSFRKLSGKDRMEEIKIVTGWKIGTRRFTVSLTEDKLDNWSNQYKVYFLENL